MKYFFYLILSPLIFFFSKLPFKILYLFSDFIYFMVYHVFSYRKKVVRENLNLAFPDKSEDEKKQIEKKFYKHFTDLLVEMLKAYSMSLKTMNRRMKYKNIELLNQFAEQGRDVILVGGHYGNWEWLFSLAPSIHSTSVATYSQIRNKYFEKFMLENRKRFGGELVVNRRLTRFLEKMTKQNKKFVLGLLADQSPQIHKSRYWRTFFNRLVPVHVGPEELAKKYDAVVVFLQISKIKRGFYEVEFVGITDTPNNLPNYEITDRFIELLENQIRKKPEYYLWTHKRFKHLNKLEERKKLNKKLKIKE